MSDLAENEHFVQACQAFVRLTEYHHIVMDSEAVFTGSLQFSLDGATDAQITSQGRGYQITTAVELTLAAHSHVQVSEYTETCKMKLVLICSVLHLNLAAGIWHFSHAMP